MKIISRMLLIMLLLLGLSLPLAYTASAMAQITMVNRSQLTLSLYIDGNFGCGPVMPLGHFTNSPGLFCTSSITPGPHLLEAREGEKVMKHEDNVNIGDGTSPTWTVTIEDPDQALIRNLDGARYIYHLDSSFMKQDERLDIRGTTLIWSQRLLWATSEGGIAQSIASGTNGFRQKTIGVWQEYVRMQIIGHEARYKRVHSNGSVEEGIFTISEDGNSINSETATFYRQ
jgi:hypothetical protein